MRKRDINLSEIKRPPHRCLLGNFAFIFVGCFPYSFAVIMILSLLLLIYLLPTICLSVFYYFVKLTLKGLRSSLHGDVLEVSISIFFYIRETHMKTNIMS